MEILKSINHNETSICAKAERNLLKTIGGDCDTAVGGFAHITGDNLNLKGELFSDNGEESFQHEINGKIEDAYAIGENVGIKLLKLAGSKFKKK